VVLRVATQGSCALAALVLVAAPWRCGLRVARDGGR